MQQQLTMIKIYHETFSRYMIDCRTYNWSKRMLNCAFAEREFPSQKVYDTISLKVATSILYWFNHVCILSNFADFLYIKSPVITCNKYCERVSWNSKHINYVQRVSSTTDIDLTFKRKFILVRT